MLEGGADIRFIQQMLGHSELTSTQVYTHVSIDQLRRVHATTHPSEKQAGAGPQETAPSEGMKKDLGATEKDQ